MVSVDASVNISAIVPAYNVEAYIAEALDSLLNQSAPFHEIIIVNDGSSDATAGVLARYQHIAGVTILHTDNQGQASARNLAITQASGDYLYFFDADDVLDGEFVATMHTLLTQQAEADIVYFSGASFLDSGCESSYLPAYDRQLDQVYGSGVEATGAMLRAGVYFASPCLYLSRRSLWGGQGLQFLPIVHEDEEIIMRLSCLAGVSVCVSTVFFQRRIRAESTMTLPKSQRNTLGYLRTLESIAQFWRQNRVRLRSIRAELVRRFYNILRGYLALCTTIKQRPAYGKLLVLMLELGHLPGLRQLYEMSVSPGLHRRLAGLKRTLSGQGGA